MLEKKIYYSPLYLLSYFKKDIEKLDVIIIQKIKKQALLELQLTDNQFLKINNYQYSKQSILDFFNEINDVNFDYHLYIWKNKDLLYFLEKQVISKILITEGLIENTSDINYNLFVTPFLANSINLIAKKDLKRHHYTNIINFISTVNEFEIENRAIAIKPILQYYKNSILKIDQVSTQSHNIDLRNQFYFLFNEEYYILINSLSNTFSYIIDDLADSLTNFVYFNHEKDSKICKEVSEKALLLNCSFEKKAVLKQNDEAIKSNTYNYLKLFAFIIFVVLRIGYCQKNNNNNPKFQYEKYNVKFYNENLNNSMNDKAIDNYQSKIISIISQTKKDFSRSETSHIFESYSQKDSYINYKKKAKIKIINNTVYDAVFIAKNRNRFIYKKVNSKEIDSCLVESLDLTYFFYLGNQWDTVQKLDYSNYSNNYKKEVRTSINGSFAKIDTNTMKNLKVKYHINTQELLDNSKIEIDYSETDSMIYISNYHTFPSN